MDLKSAPVAPTRTQTRLAHSRGTRDCQPYRRSNSRCPHSNQVTSTMGTFYPDNCGDFMHPFLFPDTNSATAASPHFTGTSWIGHPKTARDPHLPISRRLTFPFPFLPFVPRDLVPSANQGCATCTIFTINFSTGELSTLLEGETCTPWG